MTVPTYDPGRCINCGAPISDTYPPASGCCHQSECWGPGTGPGRRRAGFPPDCPHGLYRGDWCDECGDVPYPEPWERPGWEPSDADMAHMLEQ